MLTPRFIIDHGHAAFRGDVEYLPGNHAIAFRPSAEQSEGERQTLALGTRGVRLALNELELLVQAGTHRVLWPSGPCPGDLSWEETDQEPITALPGGLHLVDGPLGAAPRIRLGDVGEWETRINRRQQTIFLTHWSGAADDYVQICTGVVAGLTHHQLVSIQITTTRPTLCVDPAREVRSAVAGGWDVASGRPPVLVPRFSCRWHGIVPQRSRSWRDSTASSAR